MSPLSTEEVARLVGISRVTLERWLAQKKIPMPKRVFVGTRVSRIWTERDIERVRRHREKFYGKGRGRKKKPKT